MALRWRSVPGRRLPSCPREHGAADGRGQDTLEATLKSAAEISFTILGDDDLPARFHPARVQPADSAASFARVLHHDHLGRVFASGIVSLTLTPLMCSRLLGQRGAGGEEDVDGSAYADGAIEQRVLAGYGRSLGSFFRQRWVSALIWVLCLGG